VELRRGLVLLVLACALGTAVSGVGAAPVVKGTVDAYRAQASYDALVRWFTLDGRFSGTREDATAAQATAYAWPVSQAIAASLAMAAIPGLSSRYDDDAVAWLGALDSYRDGGTLPAYASAAHVEGSPTAPVFYDDNEWIALDLLGAYALTHDPAQLGRARAIFELVVSGWGSDATVCPGGVYWTRSGTNRDRNAVTTENGALLALRLYELTHQHRYLRWALFMYRWSQNCLQRDDGLLADHIAADGSRDERAWSYNQGAAIAVAVLLAQSTGVSRYLDEAEQRALRALAYYGSFGSEPRIFVAIFFRDLSLLDAVRPRVEYTLALARYAHTAWLSARDATTGLFTGGGSATLLDQAAMVQIYAQLARGRTSGL
jgi:hypothetical protein